MNGRKVLGFDQVFSILGTLVCLSGAFLSFLLKKPRSMILSLWGCGIGMGAIYLANGLELIALTQWLSSTLIAVSLLFAASLLKLNSTEIRYGKASIFGGGLILVFFLFQFLFSLLNGDGPAVLDADSTRTLAVFGENLVENYFVVIVATGILLMVSVVGFGIFSRRED